MNKILRLLLFFAAYAIVAVPLLTMHTFGGAWWLIPLAGVLGMVLLVIGAESKADEVVRATALRAYRIGFWTLVLILIGSSFARAFGHDVSVHLAWVIGLGVWVLIYSIALWRLR